MNLYYNWYNYPTPLLKIKYGIELTFHMSRFIACAKLSLNSRASFWTKNLFYSILLLLCGTLPGSVTFLRGKQWLAFSLFQQLGFLSSQTLSVFLRLKWFEPGSSCAYTSEYLVVRIFHLWTKFSQLWYHWHFGPNDSSL